MVDHAAFVAEQKPQGAAVDDRRVIHGILWRFRTGSPWTDVPECYGPYTTCHKRFVRWRKAGVWDGTLEAVSQVFDGELQMIDSYCIRVHQHGRSRSGVAFTPATCARMFISNLTMRAPEPRRNSGRAPSQWSKKISEAVRPQLMRRGNRNRCHDIPYCADDRNRHAV